MKAGWFAVSVLCVASACGTKPQTKPPPPVTSEALAPAIDLEPSALQKQLANMTPATWEMRSSAAAKLDSAIAEFHRKNPSRRGYIAVDKPLYRPGETVWFRAFDLGSRELAARQEGHATFNLISPKGATVATAQTAITGGNAASDFDIPGGVVGGEYKLTYYGVGGVQITRPIIISTYQPPRIKKKLKFLRKAYGPGDKVAAALSLARATGEALVSQDIVGVVRVDGAEIARVPLATDSAGNTVVRFDLPGEIAVGDGLLTILVNDGGVTESVQRRIPIALKKLAISAYPEGGQLVAGLPGRVYVSARNAMGKPADIVAKVVDDQGAVVTRFRSVHGGMGRFEITPQADRSYTIVVEKPIGIETNVSLPSARESGCSMQSVDDFNSVRDEVRVAVWCTQAQRVVASASLRERILSTAAVTDVGPDKPTVIALPQPMAGEGVVRVTLFDDATRPLAERLVYRGSQTAGLSVELRADRESYNPRDKVEVSVTTKDADGKPIAADLALAVVDDSVLSFADDKTATMMARLLLEAEMPGQKIDEPNFYFSDDKLAPIGRDLVLGTHGWRRFDWGPVFGRSPRGRGLIGLLSGKKNKELKDQSKTDEEKTEEDKKVAPAKPAPLPAPNADPAPPPPPPVDGIVAGIEEAEAEPMIAGEAKLEKRKGDDFGDEDRRVFAARQQAVYRVARKFPVPNYSPDYTGPRSDFRETIYWTPQLKTDADGNGKVSFFTSDSVTSFRAIAEGFGGGALGRGEALLTSKLPVSLAVKMPLEVSSGDRLRLPVTVANESKRPAEARIEAQFGPAFKPIGAALPSVLELAPGQRKALFYELEVVGTGEVEKDGAVRFAATAANLKDEVERTIKVAPRGFPQEMSVAGTVKTQKRHEITLPQMLPGTLSAELVMFPSPLATMIKGTESIVREPYGCFEQASSANYPNIMVLDYLEEHGKADPKLVERTQGFLDRGYKKLTGYESPKKGYEWFGGDPGHEALTAYGLMEFVDMTKVYDDVDRQMIARTAKWLKSRRDGKGGYKRNSRALDSFGAASPEVTNAYITYALAVAGETGIDTELDAAHEQAGKTKDPYVLALSVGALLATESRRASAGSGLARLVKMQGKDGAFTGADHSITRSGGIALTIETTSLAALAMMADGHENDAALLNSIRWLNDNRDGFGGYGSTQSTVLALKAMTGYAAHSRVTQSAGVATVTVNGEQVGRIAFDKGHQGELRFDLSGQLKSGKNVVVVELDSKSELPYSAAVTYSTELPASSPETAVAVETSLDKSTVSMGEGVQMKVKVKNTKSEGIPMAIARIGIPGGLTFQTWQLKELRDKKVIDFYETREREVILYFRSMAPKRVADVKLELLAQVPGKFTAPASRAYLYYTDEFKHWVAPVAVTVR